MASSNSYTSTVVTEVAKKREHLSIGEVLTLLQDDFPDLTITKIRFLESQGLIDPERTASGYRKFYKFDIERLRWVLRQQREHFLPLKVIKDRLDDADGKQVSPATEAQPQLSLQTERATDDPPPIWMADHARVTAANTATHATAAPTVAGPSGTAASPDDAGQAPGSPTTANEPATSQSSDHATPAPKQSAMHAGKPGSTNDGAAPKESNVANASLPAALGASTEPKAASHVTPKEHKMAEQAGTGHGAAKPPTPQLHATDLGSSGVSMTLAELAGASGLSTKQIEELESYGLIVPDKVGTESIYHDGALLVARHAATFFQAGLEARHLRAFKVAADREAGLYEQLILPLVKQRNPQSARQAAETLRKLAQTGSAMHAAMLRESLRPYLDR